MNCSEAIALQALEIGAIQLKPEEPFTWASGYRMPIYNDNRLLLWRPQARRLVAEGFADFIKSNGLAPALVAGTATAGIPHATTLADLLQLPLVYIRDKAKDHGMQNQIEGLAKGANLAGKTVVLIEDLISTGGSSLKAVQALRQAGADCKFCLAIFSYGFGEAKQAFAGLQPTCFFHALLDFPSLVRIAAAHGYIGPQQEALLRAWSEDPFAWGEKHGYPKKEK